jgi:hypothetical protein
MSHVLSAKERQALDRVTIDHTDFHVKAKLGTAGWPWTFVGLLAVVVGLLSLCGSVRDTGTPWESRFGLGRRSRS